MQDREELWRTGKDEPVQVNQRALIDKVLARYSGEFTLFRELLQNFDDARSRVVEIRFETTLCLDQEAKESRALPDLMSTSAVQWTFRNDGDAFTEKDWMRLPRIAEGNPGPEKIGAFGVGFYSLFSVTDQPFVSSGGQGMQFYWKDDKDQLYVRRGELPPREIPNPWTTFEMPLREEGPIPSALELIRFLASSITFMVNLREVRVLVDEHCIGYIKKSTGTVQTIDIPEELKHPSPSGIMNVKEIQYHPITIEAEVAQAVCATEIGKPPFQGVTEPRNGDGFFNPNQLLSQVGIETVPQQPVDPAQMYRTTVDLTVFTAEVKVELDKKLFAELLRSTKKEPPTQLTYSLIYTGKAEYDRSLADQGDLHGTVESVFQGLRADLNGSMHTRIFIGHATGQTTGIGGHMASYFIPTVERESIDLNDRNIAIWNGELLYVGGFLCRAVYELELSKIQQQWEGLPGFGDTPEFRPPAALQQSLHRKFLHILKFFTFHRSTPSPKVARLLEDAFYGCSTAPLRFLSSAGVRLAPEIKEYDLDFAKFLKYLPMLPQYVITECPGIINALPDQHKISPITFSDVLQDLQKHALTEDELVSCLRWWTTRLKQDNSSCNTAQLLRAITLGYSANGTTLRLSSVEYFIGSECSKARVPLDGPLPASLIPHNITTRFTPADLVSFGWKEFTVIDWLRHISLPEVMSADPSHDFTSSIEWSEHVLTILSGVLPSEKLQRATRSTFRGKNCIPTTHGLRSPEESFLSSTNIALFRGLDLPIVRFTMGLESKGDVELFLSSIGIQKHVPPQLLLDRMTETGNWSISDLIGYLVHIQGTLSPDEISRLISFEAFTQEGAQDDMGERQRYRARDLYPPLDIFRQLHLPVIDWGEGSKWRNESDHAELLYRLGLRHYPPLETVVTLCTSSDATVGETAFKYLCDNLRSNYSHYNPDNFRDIAFIPAENEHGTCLAKLGDVCLGTRWKALGFSVVHDIYRKALVTELGVQQHPPTSRLLQLLETTPPSNEEAARQWFESLLDCIPSFSQRELTRLSELLIVPTRSPSGWQQLAPTQCYLGEGTKDEFHAKLFVFVDFGSTANRFLKACGSRNEPSVKDIAESLVENPERFYELAGGHDGFLAELRDLASRSRRIPNITLSKMMSKPILLGIRRKKIFSGGDREYEHALRGPAEIVIADDKDSLKLFGDAIFVAPQELEAFYVSLGCRRLSTVVQEKYKVSKEMQDTKISAKVQSLVLQRLPLFLRLRDDTLLQVPTSWVPSPENFNVRVCEKLLVSKTLTIGNNQMTREQHVWAATKCDEEDRIELWLSGNAEPDMYEIATSLCRLLFGTAKDNHALLLTAILSTPLEILKRRYNVDKIPNQHGQQPEELMEEVNNCRYVPHAMTPMISATSKASEQPIMTTDPSTVIASNDSSANQLVPSGSGTPSRNAPSPTLVHQSVGHASNISWNPIQNLTRRLIPRVRTSEIIRNTPFPQPSWTPRQVIPQSYIRANVGKAIKSCNPEGGKLLHHRNKIEEIREFPNAGYCDVSGQAGRLKRRGKMGPVKVFTTEDVPDGDMFMTSMHNILVRFVDVLTPLAELYGISLNLLHVFYDVAGGPIAFNREGSIFLNLRYFEAWHDQDVQKGDRQQAQTSWFLALAHELAHNLIKEHNSEHEFWFSAICEAHVVAFSRLLRPMPE